MSCPETLRTHAWLDGELDETTANDAERHVENCAECESVSVGAAHLSDAMRQSATRHRAPDHLRARITATLDSERAGIVPRNTNPRSFWFGAASGAGISALAAGLAILFMLPPAADRLAQSVTDAHTGALITGRTIEVASSSHHIVKPWFAGRVEVSPPVADFAAEGFVLTGGRVDEIAGARAAVVVYAHGKHEIDLFVWAERGSALPGETTRRGFHAIFWKRGDLDFAAISDTERGELQKFVRLVQSEPE